MADTLLRFTKRTPCPICQGQKELPQGHGQRCYGFLSSDQVYAHCTREERAGGLPQDSDSQTYAHRLIGDCKCGTRHDPNLSYTSSNGHKREVTTYDYVDARGILRYQTVRYEPKNFVQRRPDGHGDWIWNLKGVSPLIYNLPAVLEAIDAKQTICAAEGEEDVKALGRHGKVATCNHGGAEKWGNPQSQFLKGAVDVVLFGDNDEAGRRHLAKQIRSLRTVKIIPRIAQLDGLPEHGDIRDWLKTHTQEDLDRVVREATPATDEDSSLNSQDRRDAHDPQDRWILGAQGKPISSQHNALLWLSAEGYTDRIALDTFKQGIAVDGAPLTDDVTIEMVRQMEASTLVRWTETHVHSAIVSLGNRRAHSSLTTWLNSLRWDKTKRLDTFFAHTYGAEYSTYTSACGYVLFISAVARAYQPGCQADVVVVLIGDQGIGKSRGIADLVPDSTWYTDDLGGDLYDKKAGEGLQGKWLIEFGEFARINRATLDVVKAFLSRRVDHYRPAYGRIAKDFPRQCVFVGSTNNDQPLQDLENRRFMPVKCYDQIADIAPQREQLWAEAVYRYKEGEPWWVTDKTLLTTVKEQQENARQHDEWEEILRESLKPLTQITLSEAANRLHISVDHLDKSTQTRLGLVMKAIGFIRKRESSGDRAWYYVREKKR
jgi:hypothetical protein